MPSNGDGPDGSGGTATAGAATDGQAGPRARGAPDPPLAARRRRRPFRPGSATGSSSRASAPGASRALGDRAEVTEAHAGGELNGDAFAISTDAGTLARAGRGRQPAARDGRRQAAAARQAPQGAGPSPPLPGRRPSRAREDGAAGRSRPPLPRRWPTRSSRSGLAGTRFRVGYELVGDGGGAWTIVVDDGAVSCERGLAEGVDGIVRMRLSDWLRLLSGELKPTDAMRLGLTEIEGSVPPVTLLGRWIDRAEGVDGPELEREERQRDRPSAEAERTAGSVTGDPPTQSRAAG